MTADLKTLAEKVEGLQAPCRETDLALHVALFPDGDIARTVGRDFGGLGRIGVRSWGLSKHGVFITETRDERGDVWASGSQPLPHLTGSLDAVLALIGEKLPGAAIAFEGPDENGTWWGTVGGGPVIACRTPALALLAATLRALGESHDR